MTHPSTKAEYAVNLTLPVNGLLTSTSNVPLRVPDIVRPSAELHTFLHSVVLKAIVKRTEIKSLLFTEFGNVAPLHVSLSRPLVLWTREKDDFLNSLTAAVHSLR
jgi:hypothetical protein